MTPLSTSPHQISIFFLQNRKVDSDPAGPTPLWLGPESQTWWLLVTLVQLVLIIIPTFRSAFSYDDGGCWPLLSCYYLLYVVQFMWITMLSAVFKTTGLTPYTHMVRPCRLDPVTTLCDFCPVYMHLTTEIQLCHQHHEAGRGSQPPNPLMVRPCEASLVTVFVTIIQLTGSAMQVLALCLQNHWEVVAPNISSVYFKYQDIFAIYEHGHQLHRLKVLLWS